MTMRMSMICRRTLFLACGFQLVCLALGCGKTTPPEEGHDPAPVEASAASLVKMGEWTELLGTTQPLPDRVARISAAVEGHVLSVLVDGKGKTIAEGQRVEKGQMIARLDDQVIQANRNKIAAQLGELAELKQQAQYSVQLAEIDVKRLEELRRGSSAVPLASRIELEKAQIAVKEAKSREKAVAARESLVRAELKALDAQLEFYTLRAPIAGQLGQLQVVPGQTLTPGTTVADVVDLDQIDALCYAPPDAAARLVLNQTARLLVAGINHSPEHAQSLSGKVVFIAVQAQPETGNIAVKVRFANPDLKLRAHAIVRVQVLTQAEKERLTIPEKSVEEDLDTPTVLAVEDVKTEMKEGKEQKIGKARKLEAVLGVRDREQGVVEIRSLEEVKTETKDGEEQKVRTKVDPRGLLFVTSGGHGLETGDAVKLEAKKEADKEAK
jgi:RND family efflux transporter MFP subunit